MIRVLVVDDDDFRVADLHAQFVRAVPGFEVVAVALDGAQALTADRELAPDLVLLDMYLPDVLGTDLLPQLTGDVLMITAAADAASVRAALGRGAVNYLVKPFGAVELADRLRAYAKYATHLRGDGTLDQIEIDRAVRLLREGDRVASAVPKGRSAQTGALVLQALRAAQGPMSAGELAAVLGVSRATAQRYLADLADDGASTSPWLRQHRPAGAPLRAARRRAPLSRAPRRPPWWNGLTGQLRGRAGPAARRRRPASPTCGRRRAGWRGCAPRPAVVAPAAAARGPGERGRRTWRFS